MAVNLTVLNGIVTKFRKASPNIAAAFDEVGKLLTKVDAELWAAVGDLSTRVSALEDETETPPEPPPGNLNIRWLKVSDIPDLHDGDRGRLTDVQFTGAQAIKVTVTNMGDSSAGGDGSYGTTGNQNEPWAVEGGDSWISREVYIPSDFKTSVESSGWDTFMEFHEPNIGPSSTHYGVWGSPVPLLQLSAIGGNPTNPVSVWCRDSQPLIKGAWQKWLIHVHWSKGNAGYIEWWVNGRLIIGRDSVNVVSSWGGPAKANNYPTAWDHNGVFKAGYYQVGHYRGPSRTDTGITYMRNNLVGPTRESVGG